MLEGFEKREDYERHKKAELALWFVQPFVKKQLTLNTFLGEGPTQEQVEGAKEVYDQAPDTIRR